MMAAKHNCHTPEIFQMNVYNLDLFYEPMDFLRRISQGRLISETQEISDDEQYMPIFE